jgi:hypothetical protein
METVSFEEYAREVVHAQGRVPLSGSLELTGVVFALCALLYGTLSLRTGVIATRNLTGGDELVEVGCLRLLITGENRSCGPIFGRFTGMRQRKGFC